MSSQQCYIMNGNRIVPQNVKLSGVREYYNVSEAKPSIPIAKEKVMSYEEKSVGSTQFFKCEACPYMALAEDDIKFHLFTEHPDLAKTNGLADNIQIPCPGCSSAFDAEETLRTHLRNHHKMGIKDVKKMVKSLVQIALKNAKLKKERKIEEPPPQVQVRQELGTVEMPRVIEIVPDTVNTNESLPKGVAFISVNELQKMSTPNFEKIDPKEIIEEASINIVYSPDLSTQYVNVSSAGPSTSHLPSATPDLISSIQPHLTSESPSCSQTEAEFSKTMILPQSGRPVGSRTKAGFKKEDGMKESEIEEKFGKLCSNGECHVRLKDNDKLEYHRKCHQNGSLKCLECSRVCLTIDSLHTHLWKQHTIDMELPTCEICGYKTFKKHRLYNIHMKCHKDERAYKCPACSKAFKNSNQLAKHKLIHNKGLQCTLCQREFSTERRLQLHIAGVHDKIRPFRCSHCEYTATRKEELKLHLRQHTGEKPYNCEECSYSTGDHNALRRHKKLHSKEDTYKCKHCPYSSIQSTVFASHMISKHPSVSSSDLHRCPYCPYKTVNKENYVAHLNSSHTDQEGVQLLIEMTKVAKSKPTWTIPSGTTKDPDTTKTEEKSGDSSTNVPIEVYDCDSQQDQQEYPKNYSTNKETEPSFSEQVSDLSHNSGRLISETTTNIINRQYPQHRLQSIVYNNNQTTLHFLSPSVPIGENMQNTNVNSLPTLNCNNIMSNFPIRLPTVPQISAGNNITLKPVDKIQIPMSKVTGPIIKPTQILPVPLSSNSPINNVVELEGAPRKKPKISVKSNLILKGPDQENMFHSQQKMAFKRLEDNERFGLGPVTFNNLITTQFMQLPPEPAMSESPSNIMPYPRETLLETTTPVDNENSPQIFNFNQQIPLLPPQQKIQTTDPSYIKIEAQIKQNTQSPSLERMCNANAILNNQAIAREYKASPPLEDIHRSMSEIKNEVKSDQFYNIPITNAAANPPIIDQYLIENIIGEQYAGHMDLSGAVLEEMSDDPQNDVIEIDDNSEDNKLLPRFDMNFPLESLYLMHNDFHFLENDMPSNAGEVPVTEVPIINQKENLNIPPPEVQTGDFPNFIQGKKDPMMNTSVRPSTNKINVKNIELMKN